MRAAYSVDVVALHGDEVGTHVIDVDCLTLFRMVVVPIDAPNHDPFAVDQNAA